MRPAFVRDLLRYVFRCPQIQAVRAITQRWKNSTRFSQDFRGAHDGAIFRRQEADVADLGIEREEAVRFNFRGAQFLAKRREQFSREPVADFEACRFYELEAQLIIKRAWP